MILQQDNNDFQVSMFFKMLIYNMLQRYSLLNTVNCNFGMEYKISISFLERTKS